MAGQFRPVSSRNSSRGVQFPLPRTRMRRPDPDYVGLPELARGRYPQEDDHHHPQFLRGTTWAREPPSQTFLPPPQPYRFPPPSSTYRPPSPNYPPPSSSYHAPSSNYLPPSSSYRAPSSNYRAPPPNYHPPSSYNRAPSSNCADLMEPYDLFQPNEPFEGFQTSVRQSPYAGRRDRGFQDSAYRRRDVGTRGGGPSRSRGRGRSSVQARRRDPVDRATSERPLARGRTTTSGKSRFKSKTEGERDRQVLTQSWCTEKLRLAIERKHELHTASNASPNTQTFEQFKLQRDLVRHMIKTLRDEFDLRRASGMYGSGKHAPLASGESIESGDPQSALRIDEQQPVCRDMITELKEQPTQSSDI